MVKKVNVKNSEGIDSKIHTAQFSLDNSSLAIAGDDRFVRIYNLKALQDEPKTTKVGHKKAIQTSLFLPNYQLATASSDFFVITNIGNKEISGTMRGIDSDAQQIAIAPKGKYFALVDSDNQICINGKQKLPKENKGEITSCAFSPNGEWFVSTSKDELVVIWKLEKAEYKLHKKLTTHPGAVTASCFSPDGKLMATAGLSAINEEKKEEEAEKKLFSSVVYLWSTESFSMVQKIEEVRGSISSCCFTSDGKFLLTGSDDKAVRFWQIKNSEGRSSLK
jgi:WD40 repeat protein